MTRLLKMPRLAGLRRFRSSAKVAVVFGMLTACVSSSEPPPTATEGDVQIAYKNLVEWTNAYREGDFRAQWLMTDARIRQWHDNDRWEDWMTSAKSANGTMKSWNVKNAVPANAKQLPCTELGHCFRRGVQYVLFIIESEYEVAAPPQPEFAVMALSDEGWKFGGGTFLNRPMGETSVIMTRTDEARYKSDVSGVIKQLNNSNNVGG